MEVCLAESQPLYLLMTVLEDEKTVMQSSCPFFLEKEAGLTLVSPLALLESKIRRSVMESLRTRILSGIYTPKKHPKSRHT